MVSQHTRNNGNNVKGAPLRSKGQLPMLPRHYSLLLDSIANT
jgi:hypothetical protein